MESNTCWYCGKNQATTTEDYPRSYVEVTFSPKDQSDSLEPITYQVPRCINCARAHIAAAGRISDFELIYGAVILASILLWASGVFDFLGIESSLLTLIIVAGVSLILTLIAHVIYGLKISKDLKSQKQIKDIQDLTDYKMLLPEDLRIKYEIKDPLKDIDDGLTSVWRASLRKSEHKRGERSALDAYISGVGNAFKLLENSTMDNWTWKRYQKFFQTLPKEIQSQFNIKKPRWDSMLKKDQFEIRDLYLEKLAKHIQDMQNELES